MLSLLARLLGPAILSSILGAYEKKLAAENTRDRLAAELAKKELEAEIAARAEARKIIIAEQGWWLTACIRPLFVAPLIIYWAKIILWDKVLELGSTDAITGQPGEWAALIIGAYFIGRSGEKIAKTLTLRR